MPQSASYNTVWYQIRLSFFVERKIDINTIDLNTLRVKELKQIITDWGEKCNGCTSKADYIALINEVKHKHAPPAGSQPTGQKGEL